MNFGFDVGKFTIKCDNTSAINISKNPVNHSMTKHIDIRYHFLREAVEDNACGLEYVTTEDQLADIMTKALPADRFENLRRRIGLRLYSA